jgi:phage gp36-like protein
MSDQAYATGADLIARYDIDLVGDLATDDRETQDRDLVATSPKVLVALEDASGEVESSLLAGGKYTVAQLAGLSGLARSHLKAIVCGLAMARLYQRRPEAADGEMIDRLTKDSRDALLAIRRGENVFGLQEEIDASVISTGGPSVVDYENRNDLTTRMSRYFPTYDSRIPRGQ